MFKVTKLGPGQTAMIRPVVVFGPCEIVETAQHVIVMMVDPDPDEVERCKNEPTS